MKLTDEEKKIADEFLEGKLVKDIDSRNFKEMARRTKESRINLRLQDEVLKYFQDLSAKEGIPYQTLINSVLFKVATGQLVESDIADLNKQLEEIKKKISEIEVKKGA